MYKAIAVWTKPHDTDAFEKEYAEVHNPLVAPLPHLKSYETDKVMDGPFYRVAQMTFETLEDLQAAFGSEAGQALVGDARRMESAYGNHLDVCVVAVE